MNGKEQFGLVAATSVSDYEKGLIKKHEQTLEKKERDRTKLTDVQSANVGPVFLTYRSNANTAIQEKITCIASSSEPESVVVQNCDATTIPVNHRLWKVSTAEN